MVLTQDQPVELSKLQNGLSWTRDSRKSPPKRQQKLIITVSGTPQIICKKQLSQKAPSAKENSVMNKYHQKRQWTKTGVPRCHSILLSSPTKNSKPYLISTLYPPVIKHGLLENIPLTKPSISWGHIWEQRKVNGLESLESPLLTTTFHEIIYFPLNPSKSVSKPKWNPWHSH